MKKLRCMTLVLFVLISILLLLGCGNRSISVDQINSVTTSLQEINLPDDVKIIGIGEATHGNKEFQLLKKVLFEQLIKQESVYTFVLEADFGGAEQINAYIHHGTGTAKEALLALDYGLYKTEEMISFVEWMYQYNQTAADKAKIYFYGNDMQRYDYNKQGLLDFFKLVNPEAAKTYATRLAHVSNETMHSLTKSELEALLTLMGQIRQDLTGNGASYIQSASELDYSYANQYVRLIEQRATLSLNSSTYAHLRDQYMVENLEWIIEQEEKQGRDKVLLSAHNGHIEKTSANLSGYKAMGEYIAERYGDRYFAIGTDSIKSKFLARKGESAERQTYTVRNKNKLVKVFNQKEENQFYVDFSKIEADSPLKQLIADKHHMINIGDTFGTWYSWSKMFFTIEMVPQNAYDSLIIVKEASPTTLFK